MNKRYDAIIVGGGISGLGTAGLLSKAGKKVLLLEKKKAVGGRAATFRKDGVVKSMGQHTPMFNGRLEELFGRLGIVDLPKEPFTDIYMFIDGKFISILDVFQLVPERCDPVEIEMIMKVMDSGVDLEELDDIPADQWLKPYIKTDFFHELIRMAAIVMCTIPRLEDMAASIVYDSIKILMNSLFMWQASNGISEYWEAMADKIRANGGTVMTGAHVKSIIVDKGRATGVLIADKFIGDEDIEGEIGSVTRIEAPLVISAIPIWEIFKLIPEEKFPDDFVKKAWNVEERTANLGLTALLSQSIDDNKALYMLDFPNVGYFGTIFMPSNVASNIAPKGKQLFEASIITDYSLKKDQKKIYHMREMLYKDLQIIYPGWEKYVIWQNTYFHYEEPKRTPGRAGKHRPGSKAPNIEGLYFCGDSVASRALPGMECAADSAMLCAKAILGDTP